MSKGYKLGVVVKYKGKSCTITEVIKGDLNLKKPCMQSGIVFTGYHRKPRRYRLDTGQIVTGKQLQNSKRESEKSTYDFNKPMFAQDLGDEWDDYAWTADDF